MGLWLVLFCACGFKRIPPVAAMLFAFLVIVEACLYLNAFGNPPSNVIPITQPFARFMLVNVSLLALWGAVSFLAGMGLHWLWRKIMPRSAA